MTIRAALLRAIGRTEAALKAQAAKAALPDTYEPDVIRTTLTEALFDAFIGYASSAGSVTKWRNAAGRAVLEGISDMFYRGYEDAGADETEADDERWLTAKQAEQRDYLPGVFDWLKEQRDAETITEDAVRARVEQWAQMLDAVYSEGILRGKKNQLLEWRYGDTDHCETCQKLNGQKHTAKWYLARDYIPGKPGAGMDCGGYRCQCVLLDRDGNEVTL